MTVSRTKIEIGAQIEVMGTGGQKSMVRVISPGTFKVNIFFSQI